MPKRNIKLTLAYDGAAYHGWQRQKNALTIQAVLEERLERLLGEAVQVIASGRTDAGVHALNQVCNFKTDSSLPCSIVQKGLNAILPGDIRVNAAADMPLEFNARFNARRKLYRYRILNRAVADVFLRGTAWHIPRPLDQDVMRRCLGLITGRHDFTSFRAAGSSNRNPVRTILQAELETAGDGLLTIELAADGFLRHMVRNIVGTTAAAGLGRITPVDFAAVLAARDRRAAGVTAPARGLFLVEVVY